MLPKVYKQVGVNDSYRELDRRSAKRQQLQRPPPERVDPSTCGVAGQRTFQGSLRMMHQFLCENSDELVRRCQDKVARRSHQKRTRTQLEEGVPLVLCQLIRTLRLEQQGHLASGLRISGAAGGDGGQSEIGMSAAHHGKTLLALGYTVDQVVHDYGDLCQAVTDLAFDRGTQFAIDEFRTLNRCLDNAIADAVTEFSLLRDLALEDQRSLLANERLGFIMHELRNSLATATLAVSALEAGNLTLAGATGAVLKRSLSGLDSLISRSLEDVRISNAGPSASDVFALAGFIADASHAAELGANAVNCRLWVGTVDPLLQVAGNRELLLAALANLLHNAFKFTRPCTEVRLEVSTRDEHILIDVRDCCGGLKASDTEALFLPFSQHGVDRSGLGLGLSIARRSIEADSGSLSVRNIDGTGCVFTISLPRHRI